MDDDERGGDDYGMANSCYGVELTTRTVQYIAIAEDVLFVCFCMGVKGEIAR